MYIACTMLFQGVHAYVGSLLHGMCIYNSVGMTCPEAPSRGIQLQLPSTTFAQAHRVQHPDDRTYIEGSLERPGPPLHELGTTPTYHNRTSYLFERQTPTNDAHAMGRHAKRHAKRAIRAMPGTTMRSLPSGATLIARASTLQRNSSDTSSCFGCAIIGCATRIIGSLGEIPSSVLRWELPGFVNTKTQRPSVRLSLGIQVPYQKVLGPSKPTEQCLLPHLLKGYVDP